MNTNNYIDSNKNSVNKNIKLKQKEEKNFTNLNPTIQKTIKTSQLSLTRKINFTSLSFEKESNTRNTINNIKFVKKAKRSIHEEKTNFTNKNLNNYITIKDLKKKFALL